MVPWLLALGAGVALGVLAGRRLRPSHPPPFGRLPDAATPHLLPDPALEWLRRAVAARGVWAVETKGPGKGARTYQSIDPDWRVAEGVLEVIEQRLGAASGRDGEGVERLEPGFLLTASAGGAVVAALLPSDVSQAIQASVRNDLAALLDGIGRRPVLHDLAQVQDGLAIESVESVGMRLAYQVERIAGAEAYVAAIGRCGCTGDRRVGTRGPPDAWAGPSHRRRRLREWRGVPSQTHRQWRPDGGSAIDRRRHPPARVTPMLQHDQAIGAVAWRVPDGGLVAPRTVHEVDEAIRAATPRLEMALRLAAETDRAIKDPLTGLLNRRGLVGADGTARARTRRAYFARLRQVQAAERHPRPCGGRRRADPPGAHSPGAGPWRRFGGAGRWGGVSALVAGDHPRGGCASRGTYQGAAWGPAGGTGRDGPGRSPPRSGWRGGPRRPEARRILRPRPTRRCTPPSEVVGTGW